jgi:glucose-6-phosphate isomerase
LRDALCDPHSAKEGCRIFIPDNVDPELITMLLQEIRPERTFVHVVSKSGDTVETIANFAVVYKFLLDQGLDESVLRRRVFVTTNPDRGGLADLAREFGFTIIPLPDEIHGRFSVLSPSGLFGVAVAGKDLSELLAGARDADEYTRRAGFWENPAKLLAALHYIGNTSKGIDCLVLLPYVHAMRTIADWYSQLVAESLGKNGKGLTPVKALGVTDQHSQLQLYNDGPRNKLVVFFDVGGYRAQVDIPDIFSHLEPFSFLRGHSLNDLIDAERRATAVSLFTHGVPSCTLRLDELSAGNVAGLLVVLEKTVCILGELYGVNAFDQPGVEESKEYARAMLGKEGLRYEHLRENVASLEKGRARVAMSRTNGV